MSRPTNCLNSKFYLNKKQYLVKKNLTLGCTLLSKVYLCYIQNINLVAFECFVVTFHQNLNVNKSLFSLREKNFKSRQAKSKVNS